MGSLLGLVQAKSQPAGLGGPVPPLGNGAFNDEDLGIGYPTQAAPDRGNFDRIEKPAPKSDSKMRVIRPDQPNNLGYWPDPNAKNNIDTLRRKTRKI